MVPASVPRCVHRLAIAVSPRIRGVWKRARRARMLFCEILADARHEDRSGERNEELAGARYEEWAVAHGEERLVGVTEGGEKEKIRHFDEVSLHFCLRCDYIISIRASVQSAC